MTQQEFERQLRSTLGNVVWTITPWDNGDYVFYEISTTIGSFEAWYSRVDNHNAEDGIAKLGLALQYKLEEANKLIQSVFNPINREVQISNRGYVAVRDPQGLWIPANRPVEHYTNPKHWEMLRQEYLDFERKAGYAN